jgi:hypothetical protein
LLECDDLPPIEPEKRQLEEEDWSGIKHAGPIRRYSMKYETSDSDRDGGRD